MLPAVEEDTGPGQENKCRRAEMGDPAGEENSRRWTTRRNARKHSHVIDGHQDHHSTANDVNGHDPGIRPGDDLDRSGKDRDRSTHDCPP